MSAVLCVLSVQQALQHVLVSFLHSDLKLCKTFKLLLAGVATSIIFAATKVLS